MTARTHTHVVVDERELDYAELLVRASEAKDEHERFVDSAQLTCVESAG